MPVQKPIKITETVLRDAHQSLIATRMPTELMLPIVDKMDKVGYHSVECWGGATFDACLRFLKEDPWDRLRKELKTLNEDGEIGLARLFSIWANMMCAPGAATIVGCRPITMLSEILAQVHAYLTVHPLYDPEGLALYVDLLPLQVEF